MQSVDKTFSRERGRTFCAGFASVCSGVPCQRTVGCLKACTFDDRFVASLLGLMRASSIGGLHLAAAPLPAEGTC